MKDQYPAVEVEWDDSASSHGWRSPEEVLTETGTTACRSVGYLVRKTTRLVTIVQSRHDLLREPGIKDFMGEALTIPRSVVRRIRVLK